MIDFFVNLQQSNEAPHPDAISIGIHDAVQWGMPAIVVFVIGLLSWLIRPRYNRNKIEA